MPAVGQGALGIECRADRIDLVELMQPLHHQPTAFCVEAERALSRVLGGSCQVPLGAFAEIIDGILELRGFVAQPDGKRIVSGALNGKPETGIAIGQQLAKKLITEGADEILATLVPAEGWK